MKALNLIKLFIGLIVLPTTLIFVATILNFIFSLLFKCEFEVIQQMPILWFGYSFVIGTFIISFFNNYPVSFFKQTRDLLKKASEYQQSKN